MAYNGNNDKVAMFVAACNVVMRIVTVAGIVIVLKVAGGKH